MAKAKLVFIVLLFVSSAALAQNEDTLIVYKLPQVNVNSTRNWSNDTVRYRYNQMKYYVTTILPYLDAADKVMAELDKQERDPAVSKRQRKNYLDEQEQIIHQRFDAEISKLNETQGVLLIKLIARQSATNIYSKLSEYKSTLYALRWQAWAKLHGFNLNRRYDPDDEPMLEHIMVSLGYPLPVAYGDREPVTQLTSY
ncbi:MAG: hypothetical protein BGO70_04520 [Bacteroidetes bacterium 43-93]|nr:DUF4294 domain-containing protein [Bacteroidota bacterium]OJX00035.1 MAG: hypothetical protein BGO70_04520 [Bacteroidetes bacterium 43-93]